MMEPYASSPELTYKLTLIDRLMAI
jgi:hypothetical protein